MINAALVAQGVSDPASFYSLIYASPAAPQKEETR
jgi:hypothetical protein